MHTITIISRVLLWCIVIIVGLSLINFVLYIRPARFITDLTPSDFKLEYEQVRFTTSDGISLAGWFVPAQNKSDRVIILCHGYPADKNNILAGTYFLAKKFNLFYFDFRYLGDSEGRYSTIGYHEQNDFLAAVDEVRKRGFSKIGAYGFSMGGSAIIMAQSPDVSAIVADSAYANLYSMAKQVYAMFPGFTGLPFLWLTNLYTKLFLGFDLREASPEHAITGLDIPVMIIHSKHDTQIPVSHAQALYDAADPQLTQLWIIENADHGLAHFHNKQEYEQRVTDFFDRYVGKKFSDKHSP